MAATQFRSAATGVRVRGEGATGAPIMVSDASGQPRPLGGCFTALTAGGWTPELVFFLAVLVN